MFNRKFGENGLKRLNELPWLHWWQDLLAYRFTDVGCMPQPLFLAVRKNYLSVYVEGQSLFEIRIDPRDPKAELRVTIHHKFVDHEAKGQNHFTFDGRMAGDRPYEGSATLDEWVRQAQTFVRRKGNIKDTEKQGVAAIIGKNAQIMDVEVALPTHETEKRLGKIDLVALESDGGVLKIVSYEAKLFQNPELRSDKGEAPIVEQLRRYEEWLRSAERSRQVVEAYRRACMTLVKLHDMRVVDTKLPLHPFIEQAGQNGSELCVDPKPRLIIFSYKPEERNGFWKHHEEALRRAGIDGGRLIMTPHAKNVALTVTAGPQDLGRTEG